MTQPPMTSDEREKWFKKVAKMDEEWPSTPAEACAMQAYLDGHTTAHEAALRLFEVSDEDRKPGKLEKKADRVAVLLQEAIFDFRDQHAELLELYNTISALSPDEFRLTDEERLAYPDHIHWHGLNFFDCYLSDYIRLFDIEDERYWPREPESESEAEEHSLAIARRYVSLKEWTARRTAEGGHKRLCISSMKLALESDLLDKDWPTPHYRGQDPNDPYSAYDVEIPFVSAELRHEAHLIFLPPGEYDDVEYKTFWRSQAKGQLWTGRPGWSYERWTFWKERLRWVIDSKECPAKPETRESARAALTRMEEVERECMKEKDKETHVEASG